MPLDEWQRIEIAIEIDKGIPLEDLSTRFQISLKDLKALQAQIHSPQPERIHLAKKTAKLREADKQLLLQRLRSGEAAEVLAEEHDLPLKTLKQWAQREGLEWRRSWYELSSTERKEIQALREEGEPWPEIAEAYRLHPESEERMPPLPYQTLAAEELALLVEIFTAHPGTSIKAAQEYALRAGMELEEKAVASYKRRWMRLRPSR